MKRSYRWILGSQSPRRQELLSKLGHPFEVRTIEGHSEDYPRELSPTEVPLYLSRLKAEQLNATLQIGELGKPSNLNEARCMLHLLSGRQHEVITGVSLTTTEWQHCFSSYTLVSFATLSDGDIDYYVENYRPLDKAGAYGIQEWIGYIGVDHIEGSFYNVMGLPIQRLYQELRARDVYL